MSLVSIIIPVYKVEQYIGRCAETLFSQTYKDIEYIFVDDASGDDSVAVVRSVLSGYPWRAEKVRVVRNERNVGVEQARLNGIAAARGEYLAFVDSDDYIEPDMIKRMYNALVSAGADIAVCDVALHYPDGVVAVNKEYVSDNADDYLFDMLLNERCNGYMCNKMYRAEIFRNLKRYPGRMSYCEDWSVNVQIYHSARKIVGVDAPLYHYRCLLPKSLSTVKHRSHFVDSMEFWRRVEENLSEWGVGDRYSWVVAYGKLRAKAMLMLGTDEEPVRREFANMFSSVRDKEAFGRLRLGWRLTLWCVRHGMYKGVMVVKWMIKLKSKFYHIQG